MHGKIAKKGIAWPKPSSDVSYETSFEPGKRIHLRYSFFVFISVSREEIIDINFNLSVLLFIIVKMFSSLKIVAFSDSN